MNIKEAKAFAVAWARENLAGLTGFRGAYLSGSILSRADTDKWNAGSDVDIVLVLEDVSAYPHRKTEVRELLLEISPIPAGDFVDEENVLRTHYLVWALSHDSILIDPDGMLAAVQKSVQEKGMTARYIRARRDGFLEKMRAGGMTFQPDAPLRDKVTSWAFGAGMTAFPLLTAAGENCTVRRRFPVVRGVLRKHGKEAFCDELTALLRGEGFDPRCLEKHMAALEKAYDRTCFSKGAADGWRFRCEITPETREGTIGDTWKIVRSEHPEDALFWMLFTYGRILTILAMNGEPWENEVERALLDLLHDLGIHGDADFAARREKLLQLLPEIREVSEYILQKRGIK